MAIAKPIVAISDSSTSLESIFTNLTNIIASIVGMVAFIYLVYSGILYLTAAGNPDNAKKGQQGLLYAVIGIVVVVAAWAIITAVSGTVTQTLSPPVVPATQPAAP